MKRMHKVLCAVGIVIVIVILWFSITASKNKREYQQKRCKWIIHSTATEAAASAVIMAQAPGADNVALAVLIGKMTLELADVFDVSLTHSAVELGKNVLKQFAGTIAARIASQWLVGWLPFVGNSINAATMSGLVEYIGWDVAKNFEENKWYWMDI